jgi:ERCC4-related helicase
MDSPEVGKYVVIRKRPAVVRDVKTFSDGQSARLMHTVEVDYLDGLENPDHDRIVWEREIRPQLLPALDLPDIMAPGLTLDDPGRFHAFLDALNWTSNCVAEWDGKELRYSTVPLLSPWYSSVQVEDYQLLPVLQAMTMPRVNMLLADDVGLGKTIEAGLIMQELIRQRRIRRMLIVCPASLQIQWQDEMKEKFNLDFTIVDSDEVYRVQRELGVDANPWLEHPRVIASMDYLKQGDILRRFMHASSAMRPKDSAMLPWDLLVVDEAHNFSPAWLRDESDRCTMLRTLAPNFEHRLFLTATPHNGYTLSFTGLLELLDPVRFLQKTSLEEEDIKQLSLVMVRRMKEELNEGRDPPRFSQREVKAIPIRMTEVEDRLYRELRVYHDQVKKEFRAKRELVICEFIFTMLRKRLLSSSYAFARTWWNHVDGFDLEGFDLDQAYESKKRAEAVVPEDDERDRREEDAARHGAAWMRSKYPRLKGSIDRVSKALEDMGWTREAARSDLSRMKRYPQDAKFEALRSWIDDNLMANGMLRKDERVIVFTEYKDTLDYLVERLKGMNMTEPQVQLLFGGASAEQRRLVKDEFNEPTSQLRILLATDAASEGLNLQTSCRYVIHHELPWSPTRLEQRNGRVDRHGQYRDVSIFHYVSDQWEDLQFLDFVARKAHTVRTDLGSMGRVLDEAVVDFFSGRMGKEELQERLDQADKGRQDREDLRHRAPLGPEMLSRAVSDYYGTKALLNLDEGRMARLLYEAVRMDGGAISLQDGEARFQVVPPTWEKLVRSSLLLAKENNAQPKMVFDPSRLEENAGGILQFRPRRDVRLITLSHPLMARATSSFRRRLWMPFEESGLSRFTVEGAELPQGLDKMVLISYTILARNRLGERFREGMAHVALGKGAEGWHVLADTKDNSRIVGTSVSNLSTVMKDIRRDWGSIRALAEMERSALATSLHEVLERELSSEWERSRSELSRLYRHRKESLRLDRSKFLKKLQEELLRAEERAKQLTFSDELNEERRRHYEEIKAKYNEANWEAERANIESMVARLEAEEKRMMEKVLPLRHSLGDDGVLMQVAAVRVLVREGS